MLSHLVISGHEESRTCFATILDKGAGKLFLPMGNRTGARYPQGPTTHPGGTILRVFYGSAAQCDALTRHGSVLLLVLLLFYFVECE